MAGLNFGEQVITYFSFQLKCRVLSPSGFYIWEFYTLYSGYAYTDTFGTYHNFGLSFSPDPQDCPVDTGPTTGYATDGSGYFVNANSPDAPFVLSPGGIQVFKDNNGNYISSNVVNSSETDWTDTAGHLALKVIIGSTTDQFEWQDTTGTYQTTTMKLQSYSVKTNFGCSGVVEYTGTVSLPYEIDLPNGQKYSFTYEATPGNTGYVTGRLQRVTLPTGGYYEYDYSGSNDGINCSDGTVLNMSRTINDGTTSSTEQYARTLNGSSGWFTTVTEPQMPYDTAANQSVYTFNTSGQETSHKTYQGSASGGTLLHTVNTTWALNGSPATRITILENNNTQSEVEMTYDSYGNLQTTKQHDCDLPPVSAQFMIRLLVTCPLFPHSS